MLREVFLIVLKTKKR